MSTHPATIQTRRPWWMEMALVDMRHALWPWLVYIAAVVAHFYASFINRETWDGAYSWTIPLWHLSAAAVVIQVYCNDFSASTIETLLTTPVSRSALFFRRMGLLVVLLITPILCMGFAPFLYFTSDPNYRGIAGKVASFHLLNLTLPSLNMLLMGAFFAVLLRLKLPVLACLLFWPVGVMILSQNVFPAFQDRFPFLLFGNAFVGFALAVPAAIYAWRRWLRLDPATHPVAMYGGTLHTGTSQLDNITRELIAKEFRLQRNNIAFSIAAAVLGLVGMLTAGNAAAVGSFTPEDIKVGIFVCMITPVLIIILPMMIGSTAAAAEKVMDVWRWQGALPVSWRRVIFVKIAVVTALVAIVAGVLPYLLQLAVLDEAPLRWIFREAWPAWVALLSAAIGFYGGSIARDDYQGLMVAIVPLTVVLGVMLLADPQRLVFPAYAGSTMPFFKHGAFATRLLLIAALLIYFASTILKRGDQKWISRVTAHSALVAVAVFALTLLNVSQERTFLSRTAPPDSLASAPIVDPGKHPILDMAYLGGVAMSQFGPGHFSISFNSEAAAGTPAAQFGRLESRYENKFHHIINVAEGLREYPQSAHGSLIGASPTGSWILVKLEKGRQILCGPACLAVSSSMIPVKMFQGLVDAVGIHHFTSGTDISGLPPEYLPKLGPNDVLLSLNQNDSIIWKNGKQQESLYNPKASWGTVLSNGSYLRRKLPEDMAQGPASLLLKPTSSLCVYELAAIDDEFLIGVSSDFKWGSFEPTTGTLAIKRLSATSDSSTSTTVASLTLRKPQDDGTIFSVSNYSSSLAVVKAPDADYLLSRYVVFGDTKIGNRVIHKDERVEIGANVVNLQTGEHKNIPFKFPLSHYGLNFRSHWTNGGMVSHPSGVIAGWANGYLAMIDPVQGRYDETVQHYVSNVMLDIQDAIFLDATNLLVTNGRNVWKLTIGAPVNPG